MRAAALIGRWSRGFLSCGLNIIWLFMVLMSIGYIWSMLRWDSKWERGLPSRFVWNASSDTTQHDAEFAIAINQTFHRLDALIPKPEYLHALLYRTPSLTDAYIQQFEQATQQQAVLQTQAWLQALYRCVHHDKIYFRHFTPWDRWILTFSWKAPSRTYGYVVRGLGHAMTLTPLFTKAPPHIQNHVIVHECTHIRHSTIDNAYRFEPVYHTLRGIEALRNADTVTTYLLTILDRITQTD